MSMKDLPDRRRRQANIVMAQQFGLDSLGTKFALIA
jgi:hypothetical protein